MSDTSELQLEKALTSNITTNVLLSLLFILIFIPLQIWFPQVYVPNSNLERKPTSKFSQLFWFVDVFRQPLSVFSQRGNLPMIFAVLQVMILILYLFLSLIAITILIPTYRAGTDAMNRSTYPTIWSKISLSHINVDCWLIVTPLIVVILTGIILMFFYEQFLLIYVYFRQRCMKRQIPQNFSILLTNIPPEINTKEKIVQMMKPIFDSLSYTPIVIPVPPQIKKLENLYQKIVSINEKQLQTQDQINIQTNKVFIAKSKENKVVQISTKQKLQKLLEKQNKYTNQLRIIKQQIYELIYQDNIDLSALLSQKSCPPPLPFLTAQEFVLVQSKDNIVANHESIIDFDKQTAIFVNHQHELMKLKTDRHYGEEHGSSNCAFIICETPDQANQLNNVLINFNEQKPNSQFAPSFNDLIWSHLYTNWFQKNFYVVIFVLLVILTITFFIWIQTMITVWFASYSDFLTKWVYDLFAPIFACKSQAELNGDPLTGFCLLVYGVCGPAVSMLVSILNALIMTLLPLMLKICVSFLRFPSVQSSRNWTYNLLFISLIIVQGVLQVALTTFIDPKGHFNLDSLLDMSLQSFLNELGSALTSTQFAFVNYIINKYFLFPTIGLMNFGGIFSWLFSLITGNSFQKNAMTRNNEFDYVVSLSYTTHMLVISLLFFISAPFVVIIAFVTYLTMVAVDRFAILYRCPPHVSSDFSAEPDVMRYVPSNIFLGNVFMQLAFLAYLFQRSGAMYVVMLVIVLISICFSITQKIKIDSAFKRSLTTKIGGDVQQLQTLAINPVADGVVSESTASIKPSLFARAFPDFYFDLTKLPVSCINVISLTTQERQCVVLSESHLQTPPTNDEDPHHDQDLVQIAATYMHPTLQLLFSKGLNPDGIQ